MLLAQSSNSLHGDGCDLDLAGPRPEPTPWHAFLEPGAALGRMGCTCVFLFLLGVG